MKKILVPIFVCAIVSLEAMNEFDMWARSSAHEVKVRVQQMLPSDKPTQRIALVYALIFHKTLWSYEVPNNMLSLLHWIVTGQFANEVDLTNEQLQYNLNEFFRADGCLRELRMHQPDLFFLLKHSCSHEMWCILARELNRKDQQFCQYYTTQRGLVLKIKRPDGLYDIMAFGIPHADEMIREQESNRRLDIIADLRAIEQHEGH